MRAPDFWDQRTPGLLSSLLRPFGCVVSGLAALRQKRATPYKASVPVICVGNLVVGGAGKTPVAIDLVNRLKDMNTNVHVVMRGYGGTKLGPLRVDRKSHTATHVGDEALLLARVVPTWVSQNRKAGVIAAVQDGAHIIVLDDGFQNPHVHKDLSLVVVDGEYGFGNGRVMPAGPLRESIKSGLKRADGVVLLGDDHAQVQDQIHHAGFSKLDILRAHIEPTPDGNNLKGQEVYAFAGIGRPQKFFDTLTRLGCTLVGCKAFDDHHPYTKAEIDAILKTAGKALVVTTTKDLVRLTPQHQTQIRAIDITLVWKNHDNINAALQKVMGNV